MNGDPPAPTTSPAGDAAPLATEGSPPAPMEQIPAAALAELRRRADRYRFLFRTIVTVTSLLVAAVLIVTLVAILFDN